MKDGLTELTTNENIEKRINRITDVTNEKIINKINNVTNVLDLHNVTLKIHIICYNIIFQI